MAALFYFPAVELRIRRFTWRGLMIDAARHFQPVDVIKRNLNAMASMKMNVFHWHLADDQIEIKAS
jgi:hexosaminidase